MQPRILAFAIALFALLPPGDAAAREVRLGADFEANYDSNYLGRAENEVPAFINRFGLDIGIYQPEGRLNYDVNYRPVYQWYINQDGINDWEHYLNAGVSYALGPRTQLSLRDSFRDVSNVRFSEIDQVDGFDFAALGLDPFIRNGFNWELVHQLRPRWRGSLGGTYDIVRFDRVVSNQADSNSMSVNGDIDYKLGPRDRVGAGVNYVYQSFERSLGQLGSSSNLWTGNVSWRRDIGPETFFSISGGPAFIQSESKATNNVTVPQVIFSDASTSGNLMAYLFPCPAGNLRFSDCVAGTPPGTLVSVDQSFTNTIVTVPFTTPVAGTSANRWTFFAKLRGVKRWNDWRGELSYTRRESSASGDGSSSSVDIVLGRVEWLPEELWRFFGQITWSRRSSLADTISVGDTVIAPVFDGTNTLAGSGAAVPTLGSRTADIQQTTLFLGVHRRLTERSNVSADLRYRHQTTARSTLDTDLAVDVVLIVIRFDYELNPIFF